MLAQQRIGVRTKVMGIINMNNLPNSIHELAKLMIAEGFIGQGMRHEEKAADYIYMAADNPEVENELPQSGFYFWDAARFRFKVWKARKRFNGLGGRYGQEA
jgi:hypothetical protein